MSALTPKLVVEAVTFVAAGVGTIIVLDNSTPAQGLAYSATGFLTGEGTYWAVKNIVYWALPWISKDVVRTGSWVIGCLASAYVARAVLPTKMSLKKSVVITTLSSGLGAGARAVVMKCLKFL